MNTEIMKKEDSSMTIGDHMAATGVSASDLIIPKLLLMHNTSEYVGDGKAKLADIVNSQTLEVIGGIDSPIEIIPLKLYKTWRIYDMTKSPPEFIRQDAVTSKNEKDSYEGNENGTPIRRDMCLNYYVLLKKEVDENEAFPAVVSFKRSSFYAGKALATHFFKMAALKRPPYSQSVMITTSKMKKDTNTWAVMGIGKGTNLNETDLATAEKWLKLVSSVSTHVDEVAEEVLDRRPSGTRTYENDQVSL